MIKDTVAALHSYFNFSKLKLRSPKIVFYAEDTQSQNFLIDLVRELLIKFEQEICYLTSDRDDSIFAESRKQPNLNVFYVGTGMIRTWAFLNLKADLCIMTMPDLETFHLKRSKTYPVHYVYIFHALVSTHSIYRNGAFDAYDTIFCTGNQQMLEIRETERVYKLPRKNLYKDGYRPLDFLINESKLFKAQEKEHLKILIAPTWGENNILNHCINELLVNLLNEEYEIYLRPHPMTLRNDYHQIKKIKQSFLRYKNFYLQEDQNNRDILFESDLMITDWSGIGMEYGLGLLKPVLYIDVPKKNLNPEYKKIDITPIEVTIRNEIGRVIDINDLCSINAIIGEMTNVCKRNNLMKARNKYVFMKRNALNKSAKKIIKLANANATRAKNNTWQRD